MFPLGHAGIPLAVAEVARRLGVRVPIPTAWLGFGTLLPDVIDKPVGHVLLGLGNGRLVAHALVFALGLAAAALFARRFRPPLFLPLVAVAAGVGTHLVLDQLWREPATLLWPLLGAGFPALGIEPQSWWDMLLRDPFTQLEEILGGAGLAWVFITERRRRARVAEAAPA